MISIFQVVSVRVLPQQFTFQIIPSHATDEVAAAANVTAAATDTNYKKYYENKLFFIKHR